MTIHHTHPFADSEPDPIRRFRGRLGGAVTLWTAGDADAQPASAHHDRAGLTVTSVLVVPGKPARMLGLIDPDSDLAELLENTGRFVIQLLSWADRNLADGFAGTGPAPGGVFRQAKFVATTWGPRLEHATTWAGLRVEEARELGWSRVIVGVVEHVEVGEDDDVLGHRRGRYLRLGGKDR